MTTNKNLSTHSGLVTAYFGNTLTVEMPNGELVNCHLHRNQTLPVVGDYVEWQMEKSNMGSVVSILPRKSLLTRGDARGKVKPLAANVDLIIIVMAPPPVMSNYLIDRYLVAAELSTISPILVINKSDLITAANSEETQHILSIYTKIPYPVLQTSIFDPVSLEALNALLQNKTGVLVGPSGVGKSSLISVLSGSEAIRVGAVSAKGVGKHTTTGTRLYHLDGGGHLIDSPGVREFNLWTLTKQDVLLGYKEFVPFLSQCKFRDCQHIAEPHCGVQKAVQDGNISAERYAQYQELFREVAAKIQTQYKK